MQRLIIAAGLVALLAGCSGRKGNCYGEATLPQIGGAPRGSTGTVVIGRPGDCWLDAMQYQVVARGSRDDQVGYVDKAKAAPIRRDSLRIGDVDASLPALEHGVGFVLFVNDGYLEMLEGFTYDEPWPDTVAGFVLRYTGGARDLEALQLDSPDS